jgi:hypothetical protein
MLPPADKHIDMLTSMEVPAFYGKIQNSLSGVTSLLEMMNNMLCNKSFSASSSNSLSIHCDWYGLRQAS